MTERNRVKEYTEITTGVVLVALAFYYLLAPQALVTGGVTGLSVLFKEIFKTNDFALSIFIFVANMILLIVGGLVLGKEFFLKTVYGSVLLPLVTLILSLMPWDHNIVLDQITSGSNRLIIVSTLGATLTGLGLGLVFKNNATTGGSDVIIRILHEKLKVPNSIALYIVDGLVVGLAFFVIGFETTFFAIVAIFLTGFVIDKIILTGRSGYTVFIVIEDYKKLKEAIYKELDRGVTIVDVVGGFSENPKEMLVCTITKNQLYHMKAIISEHAPTAFTFITKTTESVGQGFHG